MKRLLFIISIVSVWVMQTQAQEGVVENRKFALLGEISNSQASVGLQYTLMPRLYIPLTVGIGNEFKEKCWNDWNVALQPYYLLGHRRIQFPVGLLAGVRFMEDYGHHFPVFFYGCYGGGLYQIGRHGIGLNVGVKFGKNRHVLRYSRDWGTVEAYETYRETPVFFAVRYQFKL